jgi:multidrug efflux pump subunit AcrA (membrane-fusion protein)
MGQSSPRFRKDLAASTTEADGVSFVDVNDVTTGTSFRLYDFEYQLALQLDGQPLEAVVAWALETYGMDLTPEGIVEFAGRLGELGFLEPSPDDSPAMAGVVAAPAQVTNSAEVEWLSLQNAKTTTFVPDENMLRTVAQDLTPIPTRPPVVEEPLIPDGDVGTPPPARPTATRLGFSGMPPVGSTAGARRAPTPSGLTELPDDAMMEVADSGRTRSPSVPGLPTLAARSPSEPNPNGTVAAPAGGGSGRLAPSRQGPPPRGVIERRMPPQPDGVVMGGFQDDGSRSRFTAPPPARASRRRPILLFVGIIVIGAGAGVYYRWTQLHPSEPAARKLRVISPKPAAVYRWFSNTGTVTDSGGRPLAFEGGGRVMELAPVGKAFAAGDVLGRLQGAPALEAELGKQRPRLTAARQLRDSMKNAGNQGELRRAESKLAERQKAYDEVQASLNKMLIRAAEPGEITELLVKVGATVPSKASAIKWKGKLLHGDFTLDEEDFAQAGTLDFCRVEVPPPASATGASQAAAPRLLDCQLPPPAPAPTARSGSLLRKFLVTLPPGSGLSVGQALRLARLRYDAVFALPLSAVVHAEGGDKVWVASPLGRAQLRPVTIAESRDEALVSGGLAIGEDIIIEPPSDLKEGARVAPEQ